MRDQVVRLTHIPQGTAGALCAGGEGLGGVQDVCRVEGVCEGRMRDQAVRLINIPQDIAGALSVGEPGPRWG